MQEKRNDRIWLDQVASGLGFGRIADRLPGHVPPSYLFASILVSVSFIGENVARYAAGYLPLYQKNPFIILQPIILIGSVYVARMLSAGYDNAMAEMNVTNRTSNHEALTTLVPSYLPWVIFGIAAGFSLIRAVFAMGLTTIYQNGGVSALIKWLIVQPFIYAPIAAQILAVFLALELLVPVRLSKSDIGIDFIDPQGLGGLRPIGELIKQSYYYIMVGLVAFVFVIYAPFVGTDWSPTAFTNVAFTLTWLLTVAIVAFAVYTLHRFMHREKRAQLQELNRRLEDLVENRWDVKEYRVPDENRDEIDRIHQQMDRISNTREYPAKFSIWSQLLLSIAIPKVVQYVVVSL